jgi:hypothetical protein
VCSELGKQRYLHYVTEINSSLRCRRAGAIGSNPRPAICWRRRLARRIGWSSQLMQWNVNTALGVSMAMRLFCVVGSSRFGRLHSNSGT